MTTSLATTRPASPAMTPERSRLLRSLVMKGATDDQVELVVDICGRYGFDPLLKHVVLIGGQLYVTRDGLLDNAHRSGRFDGIRATAERDKEGRWTATATVWVKGMAHPVEYTAYQPEHENPQSQAWRKAPRAMTVKCAEVMALKRAFNISLGTAEEIGHDEEAEERGAPILTMVPSDEATDGEFREVPAEPELPWDDQVITEQRVSELATLISGHKFNTQGALKRISENTGRPVARLSDLTNNQAARLERGFRDWAAKQGIALEPDAPPFDPDEDAELMPGEDVLP